MDMEKDFNSGAERLIERILADARAQAEDIARAAQAEIDKINEAAGEEIAQLRESFAKQSRQQVEAILERSRINAELDARKEALSARRAVVEEAFARAFQQLCAMGGEARDKVLRQLALTHAEGGERICPAEAELENIQRLLPEINGKLLLDGKPVLMMGSPVEGISGGFILVGEGYEKNCSFEALLDDVRSAEQSNVAKLLFTDEVR